MLTPEANPPNDPAATPRALQDLVLVGFNRRVAALDRYSGEVVWDWKAPQGSGFVSLLLDGDRLIAAVSGYIYCLDPIFGQQVWENPMKGYGLGITSIASVHGSTPIDPAAAKKQQEAQTATAAAAAS